MGQLLRFNPIIKKIIHVGDLILLNALILFFYCCFGEVQEVMNPLVELLCVVNLSYFVCAFFIKTITLSRFATPEKSIVKIVLLTSVHTLLVIFFFGILYQVIPPISELLVWYVSFTTLLVIYRLLVRSFIKIYRARGGNSRSVVFVGENENMLELYTELTKDITSGFRVIGYFNDRPIPAVTKTLRYLGKVEDVIPYAQSNKVELLFCSLPSKRSAEIRMLMNYCENNLIRFYSISNMRHYLKRRMNMSLFGEVPVYYIRKEPLTKIENQILKRLLDMLFASVFLVTIYPITYIIVGIITKLTSPGPIIFKQQRSGLDGKVFCCYKFRSMKVNQEADTLQATEDDARKTPFGDFLRRSNIDEFPQFLNVLKGDMSLVGPRPHMLKHTEEYSKLINKYMLRHTVRPGITGWAQVTGFRGETKEVEQMEGRVMQDIWYIENWTLLLDFRIIFKTIIHFFRKDTQAY
ncbi:undecaprenyl-phosphate glucose phosphotransferase [Bacteroides sp. 214]|uniref:undecaprenyl-phosphate glucose phosphotransferase n=1 Tax=Bacteroides sp. 214 TaxID=2302935 RepID=UPI0013D07E43|nr:undecaprenyl-phosphate glucose phosphotransferase [Bacteroides sp. 214]NDW12540.1 undecaprenyl-phosphate glucose phosphotransferase [Bacteroides sp. 214]